MGDRSDLDLAAAIEAFEAEAAAHVTPDIDSFAARFPELGDRLRHALHAAVGLRRLRSADGESQWEVPLRLGRYVIRELLGRGGMAPVYLAWDEHLGREVALKVLVPDAERTETRRVRFLREARALARLQHTHIVTVYDFGEEQGFCYLAMERMSRSLAAAEFHRADLRLQLGWVIEAAQGLGHAHHSGVIHRDVKPSNLLVGDDGRVRVSDFGLALVDDGASLTRTGSPLGTPHYASPEQGQGAPATPQSDVFGLGATLYELVVGAPPNPPGRERPAESPRHVPACVREVLAKALAFAPGRRYRDMEELASALQRALRRLDRPSRRAVEMLRRFFRGAHPRVRRARRGVAGLGLMVLVVYAFGARDPLSGQGPSEGFVQRYRAPATLAILPFSTARTDDRDLADGFANALIDAMGGHADLHVIGRASAFRYHGAASDPAAIARELGAAAVMGGNLEVIDGQLRLAASLVETATGKERWRESYARPLTELFSVQNDITRALATALAVRVAPPRVFRTQAPTTDIRAYQLYLQGRSRLDTHTREGIEAAIAAFTAALRLDPAFAHALAGLALSHEALWDYWSVEDRDGPLLAAAEAYARRAVSLDATNDAAHAALGRVLFSRGDWLAAELALKTALELNPGAATTRAHYAALLAVTGRTGEARREILTALEIEPLSSYVLRQTGRFHLYDGDYRAAAEFLLAALELNPDDPNIYRLLAETYRMLGEPTLELAATARGFPWLLRPPARVAAALVGTAPVLRLMHRSFTWRWPPLPGRARRSAAYGYARLGKVDEMFASMSEASRRQLWYIRVEPVYAPYRSDPRFVALLESVGLH